MGDGSPAALMNPDLTYSKNISGLANGFYFGTIAFYQAQAQFFYSIKNGLIVQCTTKIVQSVEPSFDCQEYYVQGFNNIKIGVTTNIDKKITEASILSGYSLSLFGQSPVTQSFAATDTFTNSLTRTTKYDEGNNLITQQLILSSLGTLTNRAFIQTECA